MGLIDSPLNGATEVPGTSHDATFVFLAGPIRHWWGEGQWNSTTHQQYTYVRDYAHEVFSEDFLVYAPHRAWRGPWNEVAQQVNDLAVDSCHAFVYFQIEGVVAKGTDAEWERASKASKKIIRIPFSSFQPEDAIKRIHKTHDELLKLR